MHKIALARPKGFKLYYLASVIAVAATAAAAVMAPARTALLMRGVDAQIAVFLVPLALLLFAVLAEVTIQALRHGGPLEAALPVRRISQWDADRSDD
ncbi:MAG TPA: hypothetical protein VGM83_19980 [Devosiaceae bacterium]|jgi:hypothetical protein